VTASEPRHFFGATGPPSAVSSGCASAYEIGITGMCRMVRACDGAAAGRRASRPRPASAERRDRASCRAPRRAAQRYSRGLKGRFYARLKHRVTLMRFLERRPRLFGVLFEQLATTPRFAEILQREDSHLPMTDRFYLYGQALKFAANALQA